MERLWKHEDPLGAIELILNLAAREVAAAGHPEISVAHLLLGLARASEPIGSEQLALVALRREFELLGIDPRRFRGRLRALLGRGPVAWAGGQVHRSPACRDVFERAKTTAAILGTPFGPEHLLRAALISLGEGGEIRALESARGAKAAGAGADVPDEL